MHSPVIASAENSILRQSELLIEVRRYLHRHPELSTKEYETTQFLASELEKSSIPFQLGPDSRGIIVDIGNSNATDRLAIRADIDAIPVQDGKKVDYRSTVENVTHACGHDAHASILLGTVRSIHELLKEQSTERAVRAIFQPEEEIASGASSMIKFGVLDGVTQIIAGHVDPNRDVGKIGIRSGVITAHCIELGVAIHGQGGHAARPHETIDPIEIATRFITEVYNAVPRYQPDENQVVVSFTTVNGGDSTNVIPDSVRLAGTMRSLESGARENAIDSIKQIANQIESDTDARIEIEFGLTVPSVLCDESFTETVGNIGRQVLGADNVQPILKPSMGGEDFAFYSQKVPAAFVRLGSRGPSLGGLPLHNSGFDIDEGVLNIGVNLFTHVALNFLCC